MYEAQGADEVSDVTERAGAGVKSSPSPVAARMEGCLTGQNPDIAAILCWSNCKGGARSSRRGGRCATFRLVASRGTSSITARPSDRERGGVQDFRHENVRHVSWCCTRCGNAVVRHERRRDCRIARISNCFNREKA